MDENTQDVQCYWHCSCLMYFMFNVSCFRRLLTTQKNTNKPTKIWLAGLQRGRPFCPWCWMRCRGRRRWSPPDRTAAGCVDCIGSCDHWTRARYFTGSKAEGLNLPGSDEDFMYDINGLVQHPGGTDDTGSSRRVLSAYLYSPPLYRQCPPRLCSAEMAL